MGWETENCEEADDDYTATGKIRLLSHTPTEGEADRRRLSTFAAATALIIILLHGK